MIEYKCNSCGNTLETDDFLSGQQEQCPVCRKVNIVPLSKKDRAKQAAEQERLRNIEQARHAAIEQEARRQREIEQAKLAAQEREAQRLRDIEEDARRALLKQQRLQKEQELLLRNLKECPYCKSEIPVDVAKCKSCGEWVDEAARPSPQHEHDRQVPTKVQYIRAQDAFCGTLPLMMKLAVKAVHQVGYKLENASDSVGMVTFRTGVTWGSWSGASCSLVIEEVGENMYRVSGSGKQNVQGGQILALDLFGEAKSKANKVISMMKQMAQ